MRHLRPALFLMLECCRITRSFKSLRVADVRSLTWVTLVFMPLFRIARM